MITKLTGFCCQNDRLKLAVLDYLKRFHPSDIETYNMVALHYTMYREIAQLLEEEAYKLLKELNTQTLGESGASFSRGMHMSGVVIT